MIGGLTSLLIGQLGKNKGKKGKKGKGSILGGIAGALSTILGNKLGGTQGLFNAMAQNKGGGWGPTLVKALQKAQGIQGSPELDPKKQKKVPWGNVPDVMDEIPRIWNEKTGDWEPENKGFEVMNLKKSPFAQFLTNW